MTTSNATDAEVDAMIRAGMRKLNAPHDWSYHSGIGATCRRCGAESYDGVGAPEDCPHVLRAEIESLHRRCQERQELLDKADDVLAAGELALAQCAAEILRLTRERHAGHCLHCGTASSACRNVRNQQRKCCPECTHQ